MKIVLVILFIIQCQFAFCNMASPVWVGTFSSSAFTSRDVAVLSEQIFVRMNKDKKTANFTVIYQIKTETEIAKMPLLFMALDYRSGFKVYVNDVETQLLNLPIKPMGGYLTEKEAANLFLPDSVDIKSVMIDDGVHGRGLSLFDLKYFEPGLAKGVQTIKIEYSAELYEDKSDLIREFSVRYSLAPAKFWRSFGDLKIVMEGYTPTLSTNLGKPDTFIGNSTAIWNFNKLPADYFYFSYKPEVSLFQRMFLFIQPGGIWTFLNLIIFSFHLAGLYNYRKNNKKISTGALWLHCFVGTLFTMVAFILSYPITDFFLGEAASGYHGYTFLIFLAIPIFFPVYLVIILIGKKLIDIKFKRRQQYETLG